MGGGLMDPNDPWADEEGGDIPPPIDPLFGTSPSPGIKRPGYGSPGGIDPQMQGTQGDLPGGQQQWGPGYQTNTQSFLDMTEIKVMTIVDSKIIFIPTDYQKIFQWINGIIFGTLELKVFMEATLITI